MTHYSPTRVRKQDPLFSRHHAVTASSARGLGLHRRAGEFEGEKVGEGQGVDWVGVGCGRWMGWMFGSSMGVRGVERESFRVGVGARDWGL